MHGESSAHKFTRSCCPFNIDGLFDIDAQQSQIRLSTGL